MDVLIFMGASAAFIYSLYGGLILGNSNYLFFETTASIITLVLIGNFIETKTVKKTRSAIESLIHLQPSKAKLIDFYGDRFEVVREMEASDLKKGDCILINTGDRIAADGKVVFGNGTVDESLMTGESLPQEKSLHASLMAGTVVMSGSFKMRVENSVDESTLQQIVSMVENALSNKPHIQKIADKITAVFVPVVLLLALLTFIVSFLGFNISFSNSLMHAIAVLVISCPCAMGLATPTAILVGMSRAAKKGILLNGSTTLEMFSGIKQLVFDKTGTLTTGKFKIGKIKTNLISEQTCREIIFALEKHSSHPIAKSLVEELKLSAHFELTDVKEDKGMGMSGYDTMGNFYQLGSASILNQTPSDNFDLYLLQNKILIASLQITDDIKPEAPGAISKLKQAGIECILLSGDSEYKCRDLADKLGIQKVFSQKLPAEKLAIISALSKEKITAMIGDGINDAPSLSRAHIGISMSESSQVAIQSAQVILMNGNLSLLISALNISKATLKTIHQNLFWAFFYNVIAIPLAAFGFLSPMIASLSMAFSDVIVIGNSIRLQFKKLL